MTVTNVQVRKMMKKIAEHGQLGLASEQAEMDRKTGRKYRDSGKLPSDLKASSRPWRTRVDVFAAD
jgi:hypothetical protein